jgi:hypothetical protein
MFRLDKTAGKKVKLGQETLAFVYWQTQPFDKRISAIEFLRKQVHGTQSRLQRVYRIIKLTDL